MSVPIFSVRVFEEPQEHDLKTTNLNDNMHILSRIEICSIFLNKKNKLLK